MFIAVIVNFWDSIWKQATIKHGDLENSLFRLKYYRQLFNSNVDIDFILYKKKIYNITSKWVLVE